MNISKPKCNSIHEKAIRLIEGDVVEVDGLFVRAGELDFGSELCEICPMDCLCYFGTDMLDVCKEYNSIGKYDYYLKLANKKL